MRTLEGTKATGEACWISTPATAHEKNTLTIADPRSFSENVRARLAGGGTDPSSSLIELSCVEGEGGGGAPVLSGAAVGSEATGVTSRERLCVSRPLGAASSAMFTSATSSSAGASAVSSAILTSSSNSPVGGGGVPLGGSMAMEAEPSISNSHLARQRAATDLDPTGCRPRGQPTRDRACRV